MNIYIVNNFHDNIPFKRWVVIAKNEQEAEEKSMNELYKNWNKSDINSIVSFKIGTLEDQFENSTFVTKILVKE